MKKKHRDIVVDDITYGWIVDNMGFGLRIFKDKKEVLDLNIKTWSAITPKKVEWAIREYIIYKNPTP